MRDDLKQILLTEEQIAKKVAELGSRISRDYEGKPLLMVGLLKGAVVFMSDLMRCITIPAAVDFMAVSSYGTGAKTSGVVKIVKDLDVDVGAYDILIVEDILDSGMTLSYITEMLKARGATSIRLCALLNKPERRLAPVDVDYEGFVIPDEFVVGYGLDYAEKYRNLPYIAVLKPEIYAEPETSSPELTCACGEKE